MLGTGAPNIERFLKHDTKVTLGAVMVVNTDPKAFAKRIIAEYRVREADKAIPQGTGKILPHPL